MVDDLASTLTPPAGAVVMGTGVVSVGLSLDGQETLSLALLAIAAAGWFVLGAGVLVLSLRRRPQLLREARLPSALTGVAGTVVLAARVRMLGWHDEADVLLAVATCLWLVLVPFVLAHWRTPTVGSSFLLTVATEALAVLAAVLAPIYGATWLALASFACLALGLVSYVFVVSAFDVRQLVVGRGDHWVSGGALAIATFACAALALAARSLPTLDDAHRTLATTAFVLWAVALAWVPPLLACEIAAPRLRYDTGRWSTVFPVGMYAVCSFVLVRDDGNAGIDDFARVWIWIAFAVWLVVFVGLLRRAVGPTGVWRRGVG